MSGSTRRLPLFARGAEGVITGTVVSAAVIAYAGPQFDSAVRLSVAILGTAVVYWLAHLHASTLAVVLAHEHHPRDALRMELEETLPILIAAVPPVLVIAVVTLWGGEVKTAEWTALWACIGLLVAYSWLAGLRGGLSVWGRAWSALLGGSVGLLVILLKVLLH